MRKIAGQGLEEEGENDPLVPGVVDLTSCTQSPELLMVDLGNLRCITVSVLVSIKPSLNKIFSQNTKKIETHILLFCKNKNCGHSLVSMNLT